MTSEDSESTPQPVDSEPLEQQAAETSRRPCRRRRRRGGRGSRISDGNSTPGGRRTPGGARSASSDDESVAASRRSVVTWNDLCGDIRKKPAGSSSKKLPTNAPQPEVNKQVAAAFPASAVWPAQLPCNDRHHQWQAAWLASPTHMLPAEYAIQTESSWVPSSATNEWTPSHSNALCHWLCGRAVPSGELAEELQKAIPEAYED